MGNADESLPPEGAALSGEPGAERDGESDVATDPGTGDRSGTAPRIAGRVVGALRGLTIRQGATIVLALALVVSIPFGGMRAASVPPVTTVEVDQAFDAAPFSITVTGARFGKDIGAASVPAADGRYLVVLATISTSESTSVPSDVLVEAIRLVGAPGLLKPYAESASADSREVGPDSILVIEDGQPMGELARGLEYKVAFFFLQQPGEAEPSKLDVAVNSHTYRPDTFDQTPGWKDPTQAGIATLMPTPFTEAGEEPAPTATATPSPTVSPSPTTTGGGS